ncbi:MAG: GNAT family N-acetyltransferase [Candidatus Doudnabacteria bacterium]|nr:GNAT family N-acetyltransferase [Candidatus Doudnabacteria bacterium]
MGVVQIRHQLNEHLLQVGGHIGYSVASDERRKGYATEILRLSLEYCQRLGMSRVLVTCDKSYAASAKVIQANGGVLEDEVTCDNVTKRRYWIQI